MDFFLPPPTGIFAILADKTLPEAQILSQLKSVLEMDPDSVFARDSHGYTPLHFAARKNSPAFCRTLVEADTSLLTVRATSYGADMFTPFHEAIYHGNPEIIKYLFEVYPESIKTPDRGGCYPLHNFIVWRSFSDDRVDAECVEETFQFLLERYESAVYIANHEGDLPLHCAFWGEGETEHKLYLPVVKRLFDAYPGAIGVRNGSGRTPLELASELLEVALEDGWQDNNSHFEAVSFFQFQIRSVMNIPLQQALGNSDVSLGAIKLMIEMNPQSLITADSQGQLPLHIACGICSISVVKCLVETYPNALQTRNGNNNLPLHVACREGNFDVINYILEVSDHGVGMEGEKKMLPIHLLLLCADCDRDSLGYVDSVGRLLRLNPTTLI